MTIAEYKGRNNITGIRIRQLRLDRGWSQEQLAAQMQIKGIRLSKSGVLRIENGVRFVSDHEVTLFAELFGVCRDDLYEIPEGE